MARAYDSRVADERSEARADGPTALPTPGARAIAFVAIVVGGLCGLLIGRALALLQCTGDCDLQSGLGMLGGALLSTAGVSVIAVLVLRATGEWREGPGSSRR
jgi:hypothetical protein